MRYDPASTASAVLARVGGPANVTSVTHCMTRLRLTLADPTAADEEALRALPGVLAVVSDGPSRQIVLGPGVVEEVTAEVRARVETGEAAPGTAPPRPAPSDTEPAAPRRPTSPATHTRPPAPQPPSPDASPTKAGAPWTDADTPRQPTNPPTNPDAPSPHLDAPRTDADPPWQPTAPPTNPGTPPPAPEAPPPAPDAPPTKTSATSRQPTAPETPTRQPTAPPPAPGAPQTKASAPFRQPTTPPSAPDAPLTNPDTPRRPTTAPPAGPRTPSRQWTAPLKAALRRIANVFVPLIPALIGCGILSGIGGLLLNTGLLPALSPALIAIASAFLGLIAVFVGHNTAREFGGTPVLGAAVAAVVVYPGVAKVTAFGTHLAPGQGGVLGALAAAWLATRVEKWVRGRVPGALDVLLTPTVTVLVPGLVTLYGLMYAAGAVATAIGTAVNWLLATAGALAGLLLGGLFLPLVMLGLHQALIPVHTTLIEQQGYTVLLPLLAMAGAGQVGAALAVYVRLRHDLAHVSLRTTIRSALPAGLLGVGEPLIYGVSLPLGRPFLTACAGGAAGGAFVGFFAMLGTRVGATAIGPSGWALFPLLAGNRGIGAAAAVYAGGLLTGYAVGFAATYLFGLPRRPRVAAPA